MMLGRIVSLGCSAAYAGWRYATSAKQSACTVVYYHGVTAEQQESFEWQMRWLKSRYPVVSLDAMLRDCDEHQVCITFDDGLDNVRKHALPILLELQIPATLFAIPGNLGRKPAWSMAENHADRHELLSTAEQLREYPHELIEIGSHTWSHPDLSSLPLDILRRELEESKAALESILKRSVTSLSVPFGACNPEILRIAGQAGYKIIVTCEPVVVESPGQPVVGRFKVTPNDWKSEFRLGVAGAGQWRKSWQQIRRRFRPRVPVPNATVPSVPRRELIQ